MRPLRRSHQQSSRQLRRAPGNSASQQIHAFEPFPREIRHIPFHHIPVRTVQAKRLKGMVVKLHMRQGLKPPALSNPIAYPPAPEQISMQVRPDRET